MLPRRPRPLPLPGMSELDDDGSAAAAFGFRALCLAWPVGARPLVPVLVIGSCAASVYWSESQGS